MEKTNSNLKFYGTKTIMTIDDDNDILENIREVFEMEGYKVISANNGRAALDLLGKLPDDQLPHLIFLDYMMPIRAPRQGMEVFIQEFEAAYHYGGLWIPVIHPFVTGRLARWHEFAKFLTSLRQRDDVWFAPLEEIAEHVNTAARTQTYKPRVELTPQYQAPPR